MAVKKKKEYQNIKIGKPHYVKAKKKSAKTGHTISGFVEVAIDEKLEKDAK